MQYLPNSQRRGDAGNAAPQSKSLERMSIVVAHLLVCDGSRG